MPKDFIPEFCLNDSCRGDGPTMELVTNKKGRIDFLGQSDLEYLYDCYSCSKCGEFSCSTVSQMQGAMNAVREAYCVRMSKTLLETITRA